MRKPRGIVGIELLEDGMAVAGCRTRSAGSPIGVLECLRPEVEGKQGEFLEQWVSRNGFEHFHCNVVLAPESYQVLLVEPPEVPADELRNAIRWRLKDLVTVPLEKAVIDLFELPEDAVRSSKKMLYAVVSDADTVASVVDLVSQSGLSLNAIDIGELALRNLATRMAGEEGMERSLAVARIRAGSGSLYIYRDNNMYLVRNFSLNYNGGLLDDIPVENLALELQRSVDYFERQMGQAPPARIYVCGENVCREKIGDDLKASLAIEVCYLNPADSLAIEQDVEEPLMQTCIGALGAALRQEQGH